MNIGRKLSLTMLIVIFMLGIELTGNSAHAATLLTDFEGGVPAGWFTYFGGSTVTTNTIIVSDVDPLARPGQVGNNELLEANFNVFDFGGFGQDFTPAGGSQDWTAFGGVSFWMYGTSSGNTYQFEIFDNGPDSGSAERFDTLFTDDFSGWQRIFIPFTDFTRATDFQPPGAPDDGLTLTQMWGWAVPLDGNTGSLYLDDVGLDSVIVDDFESGLPSGTDGDGNNIGFVTFSDGASAIAIATTNTPPAPVPGGAPGNNVMQVDSIVVPGGFAGFIHAFENDTVDAWTPQDWSIFSGVSFWLYGNNTGSTLFLDILDNRNPGSTTDDAERFSIDFIDDFSGWQFFEIPFADFSRKEIGNGAPNDGFTLTEVHGWAFGVFDSGTAFSNYLDDFGLFGVPVIPELEFEVDIDIKFCSDPNAFNCRKRGVLPVTIFGTDTWEVASIDISTLQLCTEDLSSCTGAPLDYSIADRGDPETDLGTAQCAVIEVDDGVFEEQDYLNPDGFLDLDAAFEASEVQDILEIFCGADKGAISPSLVIIGSTLDGTPIYSVPIDDVGLDQLLKVNR